MKKYLIFTTLVLFFCALVFVSCKKKSSTPPVDTSIKSQVQGKTFRLGSVTELPSTTATNNFTGFQMVFGADGNTGSITTGGAGSQTLNVNYTYNENAKTIAISPAPGGWTSPVTEVAATGTSLSFKVNIDSPKTGKKDFKFDLTAQ